jgi:Tfp pilus assembly protein PilF
MITLNVKNVSAYTRLAAIYDRQKNNEKIFATYEKAIKNNPKNSVLYT